MNALFISHGARVEIKDILHLADTENFCACDSLLDFYLTLLVSFYSPGIGFVWAIPWVRMFKIAALIQSLEILFEHKGERQAEIHK